MNANDPSNRPSSAPFTNLSETASSNAFPSNANTSTVKVCGCMAGIGFVILAVFGTGLYFVVRFVQSEMNQNATPLRNDQP